MNVFEKIIEKIEERAFSIQIKQGIKEPSTLDAMMNKFSVFEVKEAINQVEQEWNNGWIPCSERLPEVGETILISPKDKHRGVTSSTYGTYDIAFLTLKDKGIFQCAIDGEYKFDEVWAWQPLPPTYTENNDCGGVSNDD